MTDNKEFYLLSDLAKLMKRYGRKTFEDLANDLSDPLFMEKLVAILRKTSEASSKPRRRSVSLSARRNDFRSGLARVDRERAALLIELYDALQERSILPTLRELKAFASDNGLPPIKSKSREKALIPFVKSFIKLPIEDVRKFVQKIQPTAKDRTLQGWSDIIFANNLRGR